MQRLFIADLHLQPCLNENQQSALDNPLQRVIQHNQALIDATEEIYFLGDVFHYWLGLDHGERYYSEALGSIRALGSRKKCFFLRGNRDVLFSEADAQSLNLILLNDPHVLGVPSAPNSPYSLNGQSSQIADINILLTHGDGWMRNYWHGVYRKLVMSSCLQSLVCSLGLELRIKIARLFIKHSRGNHQQDNAPQPDETRLNQELKESFELCSEADFSYFADGKRGLTYKYIVCGHFHRAGVYYDQQSATMIYQLGNLRRDDSGNAISVYALVMNHTAKTPVLKLLQGGDF